MEKKYTAEELIDMYLARELTGDALVEFERFMEQDKQFADMVSVSSDIVNAIERKEERDALKELRSVGSTKQLRVIMSDAESKYTKKQHRILRWWASAVAVAVVAGVVMIIGLQPYHSSTELYMSYYLTPEYAPVMSRGGGEVDPALMEMLDSAGKLYERWDMHAAVNQYEKAAQRFSTAEFTDYALFYRAVALAESEQLEQALDAFEAISENEGSEYSREAAWQAALVCLRLDRRYKARQILSYIESQGGIYAPAAKELRELLEQKLFFK